MLWNKLNARYVRVNPLYALGSICKKNYCSFICDGNTNKKEHKNLDKYEGLREEAGRIWKVTVTVVPTGIGKLGAVTPKVEEWLQHIPRTASEISVLGSAEIEHRIFKLPVPKLGGPKDSSQGEWGMKHSKMTSKKMASVII